MDEPLEKLFSILFPYQQRWVTDTSRFKIWLKGRQIGGSLASAFEAVADSYDRPGTDWVVLSAGQRQAEEWMLKAHRVGQAFHSALGAAGQSQRAPVNKTAEMRFDNGSRIIALPARPETVRGYSANLILDEFAFHERPDKIYTAIYPAISNPLKGELKLRIISTPAGRNSKFFEIWDKAESMSFTTHKTSIYDAVSDGLGMDIFNLRRGLDDPDSWAQEYECEFVDASNVLLPYALIDSCTNREATREVESEILQQSRQFFCGIDIGRHRDLTVCWTMERVGDVLWTREVMVLEKMPYHLQEEVLATRIERCAFAAIDETGIGNAMSESLARRFEFKLERCTFSQSLKAKIFPALRRAFQERRVRVPVDSIIREDLHSVNEITTPNGNKVYRAMRRVDGHADRCVALALANFAAKKSRDRGAVEETDNVLLARARLAGLRPTLN